jgi:A/G-specific adenine glycosylase
MLQQTQVDRVLPKYQEWLEKYPSLKALADAPGGGRDRDWRPLGYNIRPRRLHAIARESVERYGGELPSDGATLRSFKGIGEYTAGAVMSFAFGQREAILDTNVARGPLPHLRRPRRAEGARDEDGTSGPSLAPVLPASPRLRLQPGADGLRRDALHARKPKCLICPMQTGLQAVSLQPGQRACSDHRRHARRSSRTTAATSSRGARRACTSRAVGIPGGKIEPGNRSRTACGAS